MASAMASLAGSEADGQAAAASGAQPDPLLGAAILIAEDNPYIADALEEMLIEHGLVVVGVARTVEEAQRLAASARLDLALLDLRLGDHGIDPVAEALCERGAPFVFATGYGRAGLPEAFRDRPLVEKPFHTEEILLALRSALREASVKPA